MNRDMKKHAENKSAGCDDRGKAPNPLPRKDTCKKCDKYKIKLDAENNDQEAIKKSEDEHELHLRKAEVVRNSMKEDTENAKCSNNISVCSIDLQKTLELE
ncbi:Jerky-like [Vespula maculifrons]|uniref:Jerky-like n=1 Tax=Vespula maculifrons TaxID=7453 RepID=A0ABD2CGF1_VESMC